MVHREKPMRCSPAMVAAFVAFVAMPVRADGLRCDNELVREGDSVLAVTDACGEPDRRVAVIGEDNQRVGTAFYYRQDNKADRKVHLRGGKVTRIERLDQGLLTLPAATAGSVNRP